MSNPFKKLLGQTAIYGLSSIVGRFLNYLLVPLYTYKIAAESGGYGIVTNIYAYTALLLVILTFGMETTFFRFANKKNANPQRVFSTSLYAVGGVSLIFVLLCNIFIHPISNLLGYNNHPEFITMMAMVVALDAFQAILFAYLRFANRPIKFATLKLAFICANIAMNLFIFLAAPQLFTLYPDLMSWYDPTYQVGYIFAINLISTSVITLGFIPELKMLRFGFDRTLIKEMLKYSWPLLLLGIAGVLNQVADKICFRYLVPGLEGEVQLGIYGACVKIAMLLAMLTQAFRYAYEPLIFGIRKKEQNHEMQAKTMKYFVYFSMFAFLCVALYLDIFKYIINRKYWEGLVTVPIVMMAEIFMGIYFNLSFWYKQSDKTWWGAIFSAIGCIVVITINILFVPKFGYMACAWGGFAGYGTCMLLSYFIGQKHEPIPYPLKPILGYSALAISIFFISKLLHNSNLIITLSLNTILIAIYITIFVIKEQAWRWFSRKNA